MMPEMPAVLVSAGVIGLISLLGYIFWKCDQAVKEVRENRNK